jgi:two-component system sensor histidine kinase YesM
VKERQYAISEQIERFEIFRHGLHNGSEIVTIREELDFLNNYIFLQKAKYGERIEYEIGADPQLDDCITPKLILQPLVENSVLHGLEPKLKGGRIEVLIRQESGRIRITVSDNGDGTDGDDINRMMGDKDEAHHIFALKNINERIKIRYGEDYGLNFKSEKGKGTKVEVLIPMLKKME